MDLKVQPRPPVDFFRQPSLMTWTTWVFMSLWRFLILIGSTELKSIFFKRSLKKVPAIISFCFLKSIQDQKIGTDGDIWKQTLISFSTLAIPKDGYKSCAPSSLQLRDVMKIMCFISSPQPTWNCVIGNCFFFQSCFEINFVERFSEH